MVDDKELDEWIARYGSEREALRAILDTLEILHMEIYNCQMVIGQQRDIINDFKERNEMDTKYLEWDEIEQKFVYKKRNKIDAKYLEWDEVEKGFVHWKEYLPDYAREIGVSDPNYLAQRAWHVAWRLGEEHAAKEIIKTLEKHIQDNINSYEDYIYGIEDAIDLIRKWWKID